MKYQYKVLIIGAGKIGSHFDDPNSTNILTHAHAFLNHKGFILVGFVDTNKELAEKAAKKWKVKTFRSITEAFKSENIDIVCISTSTESHYKILKDVLNFSVKLILLEKPIAETLIKTKMIMKLCEQKNTPVAINYFRRYLPELEDIKRNIDKNKYGDFVSGSGYYGKGLLNNGSHIINLLNYFFGVDINFKTIDRFIDFSANDPTVSAILTFKNKKKFILKGVDSKLFTLLEIDLIFNKQRIRIIESGRKIEFYKTKNSHIFKGYKNMEKFSEIETSFTKYMYCVADNIYKNLIKKEKIKCNILDAYQSSILCFKIKNSK